MLAYELLARLRLLTLSVDEHGALEFIGSRWNDVEAEEQKIIRDFENKKCF